MLVEYLDKGISIKVFGVRVSGFLVLFFKVVVDFLGFWASGRGFETHICPCRICFVQKGSTFVVIRYQNHGYIPESTTIPQSTKVGLRRGGGTNAIRTNGCSLGRDLSYICETFGEGVDRHIIPVLVLEFCRF